MKYTYITNLLPFVIAPLFMVVTGLDGEGANKDNLHKNLPPIDQNSPKVFETASFGLG
jgi:hypothetical protein